jgi:hypothetical protein
MAVVIERGRGGSKSYVKSLAFRLRSRAHFSGVDFPESRSCTMKKPAKKPAKRVESIAEPPSTLRPATRAWFDAVVERFGISFMMAPLLVAACESWDRGQEALEALPGRDLLYIDHNGFPRKRPEYRIWTASIDVFNRCIRALGLHRETLPRL